MCSLEVWTHKTELHDVRTEEGSKNGPSTITREIERVGPGLVSAVTPTCSACSKQTLKSPTVPFVGAESTVGAGVFLVAFMDLPQSEID